jgi:hypothetical protein
MKHIKQGRVDAYNAYVESCRSRRIIPCDRLSYERDAGVVPGHLGTSTQIVDTLPGQQQEGVVQGNDTSPRVGTQVDGARARALQEAIALLSTVMTQTFKRDGCSDEFLNGMAYGVATYGSAIKALAVAPAPGPVHARPRTEIASWAQRFAEMCSPDSPANPQKRIDAMLAEIDELRAALTGEYALMVLENREAGRAQQDLSKLTAGDAEQRKDGHALG